MSQAGVEVSLYQWLCVLLTYQAQMYYVNSLADCIDSLTFTEVNEVCINGCLVAVAARMKVSVSLYKKNMSGSTRTDVTPADPLRRAAKVIEALGGVLLLPNLVEKWDDIKQSLLKSGIRCGIVGDVLREAAECEVVKVQNGALTGSVQTDVLTEAIAKGLLGGVLRKAVRYGEMSKILDGALKASLLMEVLTKARGCGLLSTIVAASGSFMHSLVHEVINQCKVFGNQHLKEILLQSIRQSSYPCSTRSSMLKRLEDDVDSVVVEVLRTAIKSKGVEILPQEALELLVGTGKAGTDTLDEVLKRRDRVSVDVYGGVQWKCLLALGMMIKNAHLMGKLRKTLKGLKHLYFTQDGTIAPYVFQKSAYAVIEWNDILQAAEDEDVLDEVLAAECLNQLFEEFAIITYILLLCIATSVKLRTSRQCTSDHRKCVIDYVVIRSGDIEKNPGPVKLNDWLKEMFALSVRLVYGCQGKNISWKALGLPDPSNSKYDRSKLLKLFDEHLLQGAEARIPVTHSREFQLLKTYVSNGQLPDLFQLEQLVKIRKLTVKLHEALQELESEPQSVQQGVINTLGGMRYVLTDTRRQTSGEDETGEVARDDQTIDGDLEDGEDSQQHTASGAGTGPAGEGGNEGRAEQLGGMAQHESSAVKEACDQESHNPTEERTIPDHPEGSRQQEIISDEVPFNWDLPDDWEWFEQLMRNGLPNFVFDLKASVNGGTDTNAVHQSGAEDTDDPMQQLLKQLGSSNSDKASNAMTQQGHAADQELAVTMDNPDPCQGNTAGTTSQHDQQPNVNTPLDQQRRFDNLVLNFKLFTGMEEADKREYDADEIRKLSRKRKPYDNNLHDVQVESIKQAKYQ